MGRRSKIDASPHKQEIVHLLIDAQWGSITVSKYLSLKYGEEIPASSMRTWRQRRLAALKKQGKLPEQWAEAEGNSGKARIARILGSEPDDVPDVITKRMQLARLQEARIKIDSENELNIGKLFNSQSREIELLNKIYSDLKSDLQDLGVMPSRESAPGVQVNAYGGQAAAGIQVPTDSIEATPIAEAIAGVPHDVVSEAGRTLVLLRSRPEDETE